MLAFGMQTRRRSGLPKAVRAARQSLGSRAIRRAGEVLKTLDGRGAHMKKDGGDLFQRQAVNEAGFPDIKKTKP